MACNPAKVFILSYNQWHADIVLEWGNFREENNTLSSNEVISRNKTIHIPSPLPFIQSWAVFFSLNSGTTLYYVGDGGKFYFAFSKLAKHKRGPLGRIVPTNFVADCICLGNNITYMHVTIITNKLGLPWNFLLLLNGLFLLCLQKVLSYLGFSYLYFCYNLRTTRISFCLG